MRGVGGRWRGVEDAAPYEEMCDGSNSAMRRDVEDAAPYEGSIRV
jgi:hypothetical protein